MTREWNLSIRWEPPMFTWKPYFIFERVKFYKGCSIRCGWLALLVNIGTWNFGRNKE